jgi:predicted nucleotidyltransferase
MTKDRQLMRILEKICQKYNISLCYLFGSLQQAGAALLEGNSVGHENFESDIDFAVLFQSPPVNSLKSYATLSMELQDLVSPFNADVLFLHEVDHLIQLEAIKGINVFCVNEAYREAYEEKIMMFASDEMEIFKLNEKDFFEAIDHGYFEFKYQADRG